MTNVALWGGGRHLALALRGRSGLPAAGRCSALSCEQGACHRALAACREDASDSGPVTDCRSWGEGLGGVVVVADPERCRGWVVNVASFIRTGVLGKCS